MTYAVLSGTLNSTIPYHTIAGAYICQMPGHGLSRLAEGTPSESRLSIGTIALG